MNEKKWYNIKSMTGESQRDKDTGPMIESGVVEYPEIAAANLERARGVAREIIMQLGAEDFSAILDGANDAVREGNQGVLIEDETGEWEGLRVAVTDEEVSINKSGDTYILSVNDARQITDEVSNLNHHEK
jgi:hypothetical protein